MRLFAASRMRRRRGRKLLRLRAEPVSGAFFIGVLAASAAGHGAFAAVRPWQFGVTGFLGCYTTVSSFSLQTLSLARDSEISLAAWNLVLSLSLCLVAVAVGFAAGQHVFG
jgi:CrcB protein